MGVVTGLTKARMLAIEAASIVSGVISGDNLILTKHDGSTVNAGNVRGPQGLPAPSPILYKAVSSSTVSVPTSTSTIIPGWAISSGESSAGASGMVSYNSGTSIFTINEAGIYAIACNFTLSGNTTGRRVLFMQKNGAEVRRSNIGSSASDITMLLVDHLIIAEGDTLGFYVNQNSGSTLTGTAPFHKLSILKLPD